MPRLVTGGDGWHHAGMHPVHPTRPNRFSGSPLDRMDASRKDAVWVDNELASAATVFVPVWRSKNLVAGPPEAPSLACLDPGIVRPLLDEVPWTLLGKRAERAYVAVDLSAYDVPPTDGGPAQYHDLRRVAALLLEEDAAILAHARGLMHWRTRARFCSVCGAVCAPRSAGHVMACTGCGTQHFPRTDPAVIMLVSHDDRVLLGMPMHFKDMRVFTTLAGFVEPGESLEEAVAREVYEEAAVHVGNVRYHSSQPWPFPASIMLGFTAEAYDASLKVDRDELTEARWFTRNELRTPKGFVLPPPMSIARRLINDWISKI